MTVTFGDLQAGKGWWELSLGVAGWLVESERGVVLGGWSRVSMGWSWGPVLGRGRGEAQALRESDIQGWCRRA